MNAPQHLIRRALDRDLQLFCESEGMDWESQMAFVNIGFKADPNKIYVKPTLLWEPSQSASLGEDGFQRFGGIYQIDVYELMNIGLAKAEELAARAIERFKAGRIMEFCGLQIRITAAYQGTAITEEDRLHVPVSISWNCYAQRV